MIDVYTQAKILPCTPDGDEFCLNDVQSSPKTSYRSLDAVKGAICWNGAVVLKLEDALEDEDFIEREVKDIRGMIHNEPDCVYVCIDVYDELYYFGIVKDEVEDDFYDSDEEDDNDMKEESEDDNDLDE